VVAGLHAMDPAAPVHIHIAEQQREVDDCLAFSGRRPVQLLLEQAELDARWCLVHATHMG
jgi:formimidoylglutamate deiminase